jgi:hypothetical protein
MDHGALQIINDFVVGMAEHFWVDSLHSFLHVKCLFDHSMTAQEEIWLGQCETAHKELKPVAGGGKQQHMHSSTGAAASPAAASVEEPTVIEIDGDGDVIACSAADGRVEVYRVKYVRITLQSSIVHEPAAEYDEGSGSDADDDGLVVNESKADVSHGGTAAAGITPDGIKVSGKNGHVWSKQLGKTFAKAKAAITVGGSDGPQAAQLMRRRRVWHVLVEEGPGIITSSKYAPELEPVVGYRVNEVGAPAASCCCQGSFYAA